jgi:hypothetical protein
MFSPSAEPPAQRPDLAAAQQPIVDDVAKHDKPFVELTCATRQNRGVRQRNISLIEVKMRLSRLIAFSIMIGVTGRVVAQEAPNPLPPDRTRSDQPVANAEADWLMGMWQVTKAKIIENGQEEDPKHGHQDLLLFADKLRIEINLPNAESHRSMCAVGAEVSFSGRDQNGTLYMKSKIATEGKSMQRRYVIKPTNIEKTTAEVNFLHRRENGQEWKYRLEIGKLRSEKQMEELASMMKPFLDGTADVRVFGESRLTDGIWLTDQLYQDAIRKWVNNALQASSR